MACIYREDGHNVRKSRDSSNTGGLLGGLRIEISNGSSPEKPQDLTTPDMLPV